MAKDLKFFKRHVMVAPTINSWLQSQVLLASVLLIWIVPMRCDVITIAIASRKGTMTTIEICYRRLKVRDAIIAIAQSQSHSLPSGICLCSLKCCDAIVAIAHRNRKCYIALCPNQILFVYLRCDPIAIAISYICLQFLPLIVFLPMPMVWCDVVPPSSHIAHRTIAQSHCFYFGSFTKQRTGPEVL